MASEWQLMSIKETLEFMPVGGRVLIIASALISLVTAGVVVVAL